LTLSHALKYREARIVARRPSFVASLVGKRQKTVFCPLLLSEANRSAELTRTLTLTSSLPHPLRVACCLRWRSGSFASRQRIIVNPIADSDARFETLTKKEPLGKERVSELLSAPFYCPKLTERTRTRFFPCVRRGQRLESGITENADRVNVDGKQDAKIVK